MSKTFERLIGPLLDREGGYVNNPNDSGGETNFGITVALARRWGYTGRMRELPRDTAIHIYKREFWDSLRLDEVAAMSEAIAEELFDTSVNAGQSVAAGFLQRCLNVLNQQARVYPDITVDGKIGPASLAALRAFLANRQKQDGETVLLWAMTCLQGAFYISLAERRVKDEDFVFGWLKNRVILK